MQKIRSGRKLRLPRSPAGYVQGYGFSKKNTGGGNRWYIRFQPMKTAVYKPVGCQFMNNPPSVKSEEQQALELFAAANSDLEALEALAKRFNIFEILGVVRAERIHTNFLGFLLDPKESHGLRDRFLKRFLQTALENERNVTQLTPIDVGRLDLSQAAVYIEHDYNDILIRDDQNDISVIVENKIDSTEHSNQLERYYRIELERYPERTIFGVFLTIEGDCPTNEHYALFSHAQIRPLVMELSEDSELEIGPEVQFALKQYMELLGRKFMPDKPVNELCEKIYRDHKKAIDLIVANRDGRKPRICERLKEIIETEDGLIMDE